MLVAIEIPLAFALLDQPEAGDVFKETDGSGDAEFVAETETERFRGGDRLADLDPHDGPCSGREPKRFVTGNRDPGDSRCGVVRRCDDEGNVAAPDGGFHFRAEVPEDRSRCDDLAENFPWQTE